MNFRFFGFGKEETMAEKIFPVENLAFSSAAAAAAAAAMAGVKVVMEE